MVIALAIAVSVACTAAQAHPSPDETRLELGGAEQERDRATARSKHLAALAASALSELEALRRDAAALDALRARSAERLRMARSALAVMLAASRSAPDDARRQLVSGELARVATRESADLARLARARAALGGWLRVATASRSRALSQATWAEAMLGAAGARWRSALRAWLAAIEPAASQDSNDSATVNLVAAGTMDLARRPAQATVPAAEVRRKRSLARELHLDARILRGAVPVERAKRRLPLPRARAGERLLPIAGLRDEPAPDSAGRAWELELTTRVTQTVSAPVGGEVVYARRFRDLGPLLIIDQGAGYHAVLVGMTRLDAREGARVVAGQSVGRIEARSNEPASLHMQLRHEGVPLDPEAWPRVSQDKVAS